MAFPFVDAEKMVWLEKRKIKATGMWEPVAGNPYSGKRKVTSILPQSEE